MSIQVHPAPGQIVICDFQGMKEPEMTKRRPVVVLSARIRDRQKLCTVVPLSSTPPRPVRDHHMRVELKPPLPEPYAEPVCWAKADMLYTVSFDRLQLPFSGKDEKGKRIYIIQSISDDELVALRQCVLAGLGFPA